MLLAWRCRLFSQNEEWSWASVSWAAEAGAETPRAAAAVPERAGRAADREGTQEATSIWRVPEREAHGGRDRQKDLWGRSAVSHSFLSTKLIINRFLNNNEDWFKVKWAF